LCRSCRFLLCHLERSRAAQSKRTSRRRIILGRYQHRLGDSRTNRSRLRQFEGEAPLGGPFRPESGQERIPPSRLRARKQQSRLLAFALRRLRKLIVSPGGLARPAGNQNSCRRQDLLSVTLATDEQSSRPDRFVRPEIGSHVAHLRAVFGDADAGRPRRKHTAPFFGAGESVSGRRVYFVKYMLYNDFKI
jgi:hypothetical protein